MKTCLTCRTEIEAKEPLSLCPKCLKKSDQGLKDIGLLLSAGLIGAGWIITNRSQAAMQSASPSTMQSVINAAQQKRIRVEGQPLLSARTDILTKLGRVYERDQKYYAEQHE